MLEEAVAEIQTALHKQAPEQLETQSLAERLKTAAEEFESSHPTLFGVISRTIDVPSDRWGSSAHRSFPCR